MNPYRLYSALLSYPEQALQDAVPEIRDALQVSPESAHALAPLLDHLASHPLIELQEAYVATFDRSPSHSLHLFEHIHGESRDRGPALVDLLHEYQSRGFEPFSGGEAVNELPDYLPLFLEFLGQLPLEEAQGFLDDAVHVIAAIGERLARTDSPYTVLFTQLRALATVAPLPLAEPPVRDMDELLETFGPGADGSEPLLKPRPAGPQPIQFHPRRPQDAQAGH